MIENIMNSWYFVSIILGTAFLFFTRKAWNKVVGRAAIEIRHRFFSFTSTAQEQQKVSKNAGDSIGEHEKFKKLLEKLNLKNFEQFNKIFEDVIQEGLTDKKKISDLNDRLSTVTALLKFYMFSYFNLYLVPNTKIALLRLHISPKKTKTLFMSSINVSQIASSEKIEKEAIFNVLVSNNLIFKDSRDLYSVSELGKEFLSFLGVSNHEKT